MGKKKSKLSPSERKAIIAEYFAQLEKHRRSASLAILGPAKRQVEPTQSCFGGRFAGPKDAKWPQRNGQFMEPVLQIRVRDLPWAPPDLKAVALLQVFAIAEEWDGFAAFVGRQDGCCSEDIGPKALLEVRTYSTLRGLRELERPFKSMLKPRSIAWKLSEIEVPRYPDDLELVARDVRDRFDSLPESWKIEARRFRTYHGTKVGGWPLSLQHGAFCGNYLFQIGSERTANWMWGPDGNAFFGKYRRKWSMSWDFL